MSYSDSILDPIACRDSQRAEDLAREDNARESFEILVTRQALACAELRNAIPLDQQHFDVLRQRGVI